MNDKKLRKNFNFRADGIIHLSTGIILMVFLFQQIPFDSPIHPWNAFLMVLALYGAGANMMLGIINTGILDRA